MATGRTVNRWLRAYIDGYDLSGYTRNFGTVGEEFGTPNLTTVTDAIKGTLPNQRKLLCGPLNGVFDNTATSGLHVVANGAGVPRVVTVAFGIRAAPAAGDPVFCARPSQAGYTASETGGAIVATMSFDQASADTALPAYGSTWGVLLHASGAETAVNSAIGIDDVGAATTAGGVFYYHALTSNGTVTLKVQDAATNTNPSFADLSGATSGSINPSATPVAGVVALSNTATVRRYLRWQLVFGTATTCTFVLAFVRG